jgi:hypothetical protein
MPKPSASLPSSSSRLKTSRPSSTAPSLKRAKAHRVPEADADETTIVAEVAAAAPSGAAVVHGSGFAAALQKALKKPAAADAKDAGVAHDDAAVRPAASRVKAAAAAAATAAATAVTAAAAAAAAVPTAAAKRRAKQMQKIKQEFKEQVGALGCTV